MAERDPRASATLVDKIAALPPERVAEVEDFVDFLSQRETARSFRYAAAVASAPSFARIWTNREDDVYDAI